MSKSISKTKFWNIPNSLSIFRILLIIPFVIFFFMGGDYVYAACLMLALSGLSDLFDGIIARKFHQITPIGQILDPVADKLTQGCVAICMIIYYIEYPAIISLFALFFLKELIMAIGSAVLFFKGKRPTPAKWYGKVATFSFYLSVVAILLLQAFSGLKMMWLIWLLVAITAVLMINAFIRYMGVFIKIYNDTYDYSKDPVTAVSQPDPSGQSDRQV